MEQTRLVELFDAYLDQRLTETDRAAFSEVFRTSPEACRLFWEYSTQHAQLAEILSEAQGGELAREEQIGEAGERRCVSPPVWRAGCVSPLSDANETHSGGLRPPLANGGHARVPALRLTWLAALAASLLVIAGVWWMFRPVSETTDDEPPLARLGDLRGQVHVLVHQKLMPARAGQIIRPGEEIRTGDDGFAVLTYADHSRLELNADTAVRLLVEMGPAAPGKRVFLVRGVVNATVSQQPEGRPLRLSTDEADLIVPGTRFSAAGILGETRIEMEEGKALLGRKGDVKMIEMSSGTYAIAAPDMEVYNPVALVPTSRDPFATLQENAGPILALASVDRGNSLAIACNNGQVKLWDVASRKVRAILDADLPRALSLSASPDGRFLAVGYEQHKGVRAPSLIVWDLDSRRQRLSLPVLHRSPAVSFSPDGQSLVAINHHTPNRGVLVWDLPDLKSTRPVSASRERLQMGQRIGTADGLAVSPDGRLVAVGYRDGTIRLWDLQTGRVDRTLLGHRREVQSLAFQPGGDLLASGSRDGTVRLWSLETGEEMRVLRGPFNEARCMTFSPDGQTLATGHAGTALLWDVRTGEKQSTLKAHKFSLTALVYLDNGRILATAGWDRTVKLWKLEPAEQ